MSTDRLRGAVGRIVADLRARRMLPVIVLLIVGIVAIPIVLGHSAATAGPTTPIAIAPASTTAQTATTAETTAGAAGSHAADHARSAASGSSHDPFVQPSTPTQSTGSSSGSAGNAAGVTDLPVTASSSAAHAATSSQASSATTTSAHSTSTTSSTSTTTTQTTTTSTPTTAGTYSAYRVGISFGSASGGARPYKNLPRDAVLESGGTPLLVFLGVARDGVSGVFFLASGVTPAGEGNCSPTRVKCQFLILKPHDYVVLIDHAASGAVSVDTLTFGAPQRVTSATPIVTRISVLGARTIAWAAISVPQLRKMSFDPDSGLLHTGRLPLVAAGAAAIPQAVAASLTPIG